MKKILNLTLILFVFCLSFTLGGTFVLPESASAASEGTILTFSQENKNKFIEFVTNYGKDNANANIVLTSNIDLGGVELANAIGTEENPFSGIFDGQGYIVSNFTINVFNDMSVADAVLQQKQYAGFFGVTNGAKIMNFGIGGNVNIKIGGCISAYAGGFVGKAIGTTIQNCQMSAENVKLETDFSHDVTAGLFAGVLSGNTKLLNCITRSANGFGSVELDNVSNKQVIFGGIAGEIDNAKLHMVVSNSKFDISLTENFEGDFYLGGVAGVVGQGASEIFNIGCENTLTVENNAPITRPIYIGEVIGKISQNSPNAGNISYIYFSKNGEIDTYGLEGNYIEGVNVNRTSFAMTDESYFNNQVWHSQLVWNFDNTWRFNNKKVYLQSFSNDFYIRTNVLTTNKVEVMKLAEVKINGNILKDGNVNVTDISNMNLRYGYSVEMTFNFVDGMIKFFTPDSIQLNGQKPVKLNINSQTSNGKIMYSFPDDDDESRKMAEPFEIKTNDDEGKSFTLVIKSVNASTTGEYRVVAKAKTYSINFTTALFLGENNDEYVEEKPGAVFHYSIGQGASETSDLTIDNMTYKDQQYRIGTKAVTNSTNIADGWYIMKGERPAIDDVKISENAVLEFTFGEGKFTEENMTVYARYVDNSYIFTFRIDNGIQKIALYGGDVVFEESGVTHQIGVSRSNSEFKVEIYVNKDYAFDPDVFMDENDYKANNAQNPFCVLRDTYETEDCTYYQFVLNLISVNQNDFPNGVSIVAKTTEVEKDNSALIWIIVGSVGGALILGVVIFLIVYFSRRKGYGGKTKVKLNKKDYKNMYF